MEADNEVEEEKELISFGKAMTATRHIKRLLQSTLPLISKSPGGLLNKTAYHSKKFQEWQKYFTICNKIDLFRVPSPQSIHIHINVGGDGEGSSIQIESLGSPALRAVVASKSTFLGSPAPRATSVATAAASKSISFGSPALRATSAATETAAASKSTSFRSTAPGATLDH